MASLNELLQRARSVFQKEKWDNDLDAELTSHLELATEDMIRSGFSPQEARRRALIQLGGREQSKEAHRDARGLPWLESVLQDGRYALRTLRRDASFAAFVILIVALGIASTAVVFSIVNSLLLRPLPFRQPEQLEEAGCHGTSYREEKIRNSKMPNVICTLPGMSSKTLVVSAGPAPCLGCCRVYRVPDPRH